MANGPYSRIYWSIEDDPLFEGIYTNDRALALWIRLLIQADAMYPLKPPLPSMSASLRILVENGLVIELPNRRYTVRGLDKEREKRSRHASNAASMRWASGEQASGNAGSNAQPMPRRDETSKRQDEQGAASSQPTTSGGMGWRPRPPVDPEGGAGLWHGSGTHDGRHGAHCAVCAPLLPSNGPPSVPTVDNSEGGSA